MLLKIDRHSIQPLQAQLYEQLRSWIVSGRLRPRKRMAATRVLAEQLGVSRTTVLLAYEQLVAEGYLQTRPGVATFVSDDPPAEPVSAHLDAAKKRRSQRGTEGDTDGSPPLSATSLAPAIDFNPLAFDGRLFPRKAWRRLVLAAVERYNGRLVVEPPGGLASLRRALADWLFEDRAVAVPWEQVVIVSGRQQAYYIIARQFAPRGSRVVVECTCADGAAAAFESHGAELVRVPVDEHGLLVDRLPEGRAALAHVTPARQFPVGGTLPLERRERLIAWAQRSGALLVEDDCEAGVRLHGMPVPPLKVLDSGGRTIYLGAFSSALGPEPRLAYMIVPPELTAAVLATKGLLDNGGSSLEQTALAKLIESGNYARHLRRVRKVLLARRDCLIAALGHHVGPVLLVGAEAGAHLTWYLPPGLPPASEVKRLARAHDVEVYGLGDLVASERAWCAQADHTLFLGYGSLEEQAIRKGVARLAAALAGAKREAANPQSLAAA